MYKTLFIGLQFEKFPKKKQKLRLVWVKKECVTSEKTISDILILIALVQKSGPIFFS